MSRVVHLHRYGGGIARPPAADSLTKVNGARSATSGRNVVSVDFVARRVIAQFSPADMAGALVRAAFAARSENATCMAAAAALEVGVNTVRRIYRGDTRAASWPVMLRIMAHCAERGVDPLAVCGLADMYAGLRRAVAA